MVYNYNPYPSYLNYNQPRVTTVSSRDEAVVAPVDVMGGQPSFFYNKAKNEFYIKMCDIHTGAPIFKTYIEAIAAPVVEDSSAGNLNIYEKEFKHINDGIDSLHRLITNMKEGVYDESDSDYENVAGSTKSNSNTKSTKSK